MPEALIVHRPADRPQVLVVLLHGVGTDAASMVPLGRRLAAEFPSALLVSVPAAFESDSGRGRQWFPVRGVDDANRVERVAAALPHYLDAVRDVQQANGIGADASWLVGFSQGAILSLEAARAGHRLASRIASLGGRFALLPDAWPQGLAVHFLHGTDDAVIPVEQARLGAARVRELGGASTLDILEGAPHAVTPAMEDLLVRRLREPADA
jgi:phospholipase/carboxylesterase